MKWIKIQTPIDDEVIASLKKGDLCLISGKVLTARDKAHERIKNMVSEGSPLPFNLRGELIYYVGPTPARPGNVIGAAGPTTSSRMDSFSDIIFSLGVKAVMGKGRRDENTRKLLVRYNAIYFATFGGAGAYLSKRIKSSRVIAFEDLGPEAVYEFLLEDFPAVVAIDSKGDDIYEIKL